MKAATLQPLFFLMILTASCKNPQTVNAPQNEKRDTLEAPPKVLASTPIDTTFANENFFSFWHRFRTAVLDSDTAKIIGMTEFPFQTRGPLDDDPDTSYDKENFIPVFYSLLDQSGGIDTSGATEVDGINKTFYPNKKDTYNDQQARVGDFCFKKTGAGWKLYFAYTN
ncbi:hypothetical protein [Dinghuibacter silviterrae]|uniref:Uncharacterized protein n=1 Tax=Dinghuibacter silviterrae TaxID=1539049 RepID=A0A4R8DJR4_9BACT|nr:hypothetical protein [Dinghuibacter silviterrae]TDW97554.1 hypothetical protein EDB95_5404 [Dinghuibacter silviterrae]